MSNPSAPGGEPERGHPLLLGAVENPANGIMITDRDGTIQWVNPAFSILTGYSQAEAIGQNPRIFKSGAHPREFYAELWETVLAGRPWFGQIRNCRKDGSEYVEEMTVIPVQHAAGEISHFICVKEDLSMRRPIQEGPHVSHAVLHWALEITGQGVWDWNLVRREVGLTPSFRRLLGYTEAEWADEVRDWFDAIHPDDRTAARRALRDHIEGRNSIFEVEVRLRKKNDDYMRVRTRGQVMSRNEFGRPTRIVGVHSEVSVRTKLEQYLRQAQRMETIGLLACGVADEINDLLTVINGYSELLLDEGPGSHVTRESATSVKAAGERAAALLRRLLRFQREAKEERVNLDLNDVVSELCRLLRPSLPTNIQLSIKMAPRLGMVKADPGAMLQVLVAVVTTVADAMPGGGRLRIETANLDLALSKCPERSMRAERYACLVVSEDKANSGVSAGEHPLGPGLSTAAEIVRQSGGWIVAENANGTRYRLNLPCIDAARDTRRARATILVVEDSPDVRRFIVGALHRLGYHILEAGSGQGALAISRNLQGRIDLLLTDVVLPDASGQSVAQQLTATRPDMAVLYTSGYPEVIASAGSAPESKEEFLEKPFNAEALRVRVSEVLRKTSPRRILVVEADPTVARFAGVILRGAGLEVVVAESCSHALAVLEEKDIDLVIADIFQAAQEGVDIIMSLGELRPGLPVIAMSGGQFVDIAMRLGVRAAIAKPFSAVQLLEAVRRALRMDEAGSGSVEGAG